MAKVNKNNFYFSLLNVKIKLKLIAKMINLMMNI